VNAATMLRGARRGAGLSQRELARRADVTQASVSRIERGVVSPTMDTLNRLLRECGWELEAVLRRGDVDRSLIRERLAMTPTQRIRAAEREWEEVDAFRRSARKVG
jgi:transcriptional regulator with XRE-family HTH domain